MPVLTSWAPARLSQGRYFGARSVSTSTKSGLLPLSTNHLIDPDRREWRRAAFGNGIVAEHPQLLAERERTLAKLGEMDPNAGQTVVHRPLNFRGRASSFRL